MYEIIYKEKITKAAVVSARAEASEIGVAIMRKGGSAFDDMMKIIFFIQDLNENNESYL